MRRSLAGLAATLVVAAAGTMPALNHQARAQDAGGLGGFILEANAKALEYAYASPGLLATGDVIFQAAMPESYARLSTGPNGRALSSLAWPGPLLADLGVIVEQGTSPDQRPPFRVPSYPVRAEAFNPQGPAQAEHELVPGARMRAVADGLRSHADSRFTGMQIPLLFDVGGVTSEATSEVVDGIAVSRATARLADVSLLAGLVRIESLVTEVVATSDGERATAEGATTASGVTFAGLRATLDEHGIHLADQPSGGERPFGDLVSGLNQGVEPVSDGLRQLLEGAGGGLDQLAEQSGIHIRLLPASSAVDAAAGEVLASGLYVELFYDGRTTPVFSQLLEAAPIESLPADPLLPIPFNSSPQALVSLLQETHINSISLATASADANAAPGFTLPPFDFGPIGDGGSGGLDVGSGGLGVPSVSGSGFEGGHDVGGSDPGTPSTRPGAPPVLGGSPAVARGVPLPGTLVAVVALAVPFFATGARRLAALSLGA